MARTKSDIANSAIRIFLQKTGEYYDIARGFEKFVPTKRQQEALLHAFKNECCYCGMTINKSTMSQDHLIPMNKDGLGLHAWGNVVPCCRNCNGEKQQKPWVEFLQGKAKGQVFTKRKNLIENFVRIKKYDPKLSLTQTAGNLYEDVGEVAMTLINLRYKQAEEIIKKLIH